MFLKFFIIFIWKDLPLDMKQESMKLILTNLIILGFIYKDT